MSFKNTKWWQAQKAAEALMRNARKTVCCWCGKRSKHLTLEHLYPKHMGIMHNMNDSLFTGMTARSCSECNQQRNSSIGPPDRSTLEGWATRLWEEGMAPWLVHSLTRYKPPQLTIPANGFLVKMAHGNVSIGRSTDGRLLLVMNQPRNFIRRGNTWTVELPDNFLTAIRCQSGPTIRNRDTIYKPC